MAIASKDAPDWIRERSSTASFSVGTAIRLRPRRAVCEPADVAVARQETRMMSDERFHFMKDDISRRCRLILIMQNTGINALPAGAIFLRRKCQAYALLLGRPWTRPRSLIAPPSSVR